MTKSCGVRKRSRIATTAGMALVAFTSSVFGGDNHAKEAIYIDEGSRTAAWHAGWSDATVSNDIVYLSGIVVVAKSLGSERDIGPAFDGAFLHMRKALAAAGASMDDVTEITVYMVDVQAHLPALNAARLNAMRPPFAASTVVQVSRLIPDGAIAEIRAIAHRRSRIGDKEHVE